MTPLAYAELCAARYSLKDVLLKGRGHVPRVRIERSKPWLKCLPSVKIVTSEHGGIEWFTGADIERLYFDDLWAAGIYPSTCEVVSRRAWRVAAVHVRLTGQPLPRETVAESAERVRTMMARRRERMERLADHELQSLVIQGAL